MAEDDGDEKAVAARKTDVTNFTAATGQSDPNLYQNHEDEEEENEVLEWSWSYVGLCLLLPLCNGCINGFSWPAFLLYFRDMSWPIWHAGLAVAGGFLGRTVIQHLQLQFGIWVALPMTLFHLTACILAIVFTQDEWAVLVEIVCLHSLDPTMSIEAVVYDFFKSDPGASRQATSTSLSIMTLTVALSTGVGGVIYDHWSWRGLAIAHTAFEGLVLLVLWLQRACWRSFAVVCLGRKSRLSSKVRNQESQWVQPAERVDRDGSNEAAPEPAAVVENPEGASPQIPGHVEHEGLVLQDVQEEEEAGPDPVVPAARSTVKSRRTKSDVLQEMLDELEDEEEQEPSQAQEHVQGRRTRFQEDAETEPQDEVKPTISVTSPPNEVDKQYSTGVSGRRTDHKLLEAYLQEMEAEELDDHPDQSNKRNTNVSQRSRQSHHSAWSRKSHRSVRSRQSVMSTQKGSKRSPLKRARIESDATEGSPVQAGRFRPDSAPPKRNSQISAKSGNSVKSKHTIASVASAISSMTSLAEAGMHFEHHFSVNASLRPKIATIGGQRKAPAKKISQSSQKKISQSSQQSKDRETVLSNLTANTVQTTTDGIRWWVPPGYRLPALLISVAYFCSHCSYMMATSMYALYYREQHGWSMAMYAGFCQCAGENLAGIAMRLVSTPFGSTAESVEEKSPCWRRLSNFLFSKPYDVAWCLFFWACLNAGFMSPWTPGTVIAHVLMASIYVILSKNAMEMCLLYAKGDPDLFLTLQNLARNVEQSGAALACAAGPLLYDFVHPNAPFIVTASGCGAFLIIYTVAVCACVLLPDGYEDEDTVEEYVESDEEDE